VTQEHTDTLDGEEFNATLWMALADSWWDLGKKTAPLIGPDLSNEKRQAHLHDWAENVREDADDEVKAAVTPERLETFVITALDLLKRKYHGEAISEEVQRLIEHARYKITDDGNRLKFGETPEAFWSWEYVYLFEDLKFEEAGWLTAVGMCESCSAFFIKSRKDQRFHNDACRKQAANKRFYKTRGRTKKRH
jgi:hypothetical protein